MVFVVGKSSNSSDEKIIMQEAKNESDMLIFDFIDHYENLTIKTMMGLKWANERCSNAMFVVKIDDDTTINPLKLMNNLASKHYTSIHHKEIGYDIGKRTVY